MATARITWRDAQQMPEDGRRYEAVEVWRFGRGDSESAPRHDRFTDVLPVHAVGEVVGEIDLRETFVREPEPRS